MKVYARCYSSYGENETDSSTYFQICVHVRTGESQTNALPEDVIGCVQRKGLMDNRTMNTWYESMFKSYIHNCIVRFGSLLDDLKCHRSSDLHIKMMKMMLIVL